MRTVLSAVALAGVLSIVVATGCSEDADASSTNGGAPQGSSGASGSSGGAGATSGGTPPSDGGGADGGVADGGVALPPPNGAPYVLYTDIVSGPPSGGEGGLGAYLTIFGKNFGAGGLGTTLKVFVGDAEVAKYVALGTSRARSDIEQLTVRVGALGGAVLGTPLPIKVVVGGTASNTEHTFTPNPGRFIYVDPAKGDDASGAVDDVTKPFKTVQYPNDLTKGAWGKVQPGDFIVLRGGTYTSVGREQYFMRFIRSGNTSGTAPTGASGTGPIALVGYPGEDAFLSCTASTHPAGCLSGLNGENYPNAGKWVVIANLRIEGGGYDGPISQEIHGDDWRVVNNELTATTGAPTSRMAGITGNGKNAFWLGNHIHDIHGSQFEAHGIYIDGDGSYEIAYNVVHDCASGKGIQMFANGGNGSDVINDVHIHHNLVHDVRQFGINVADGSSNGFEIYDNVVYNATTGAIRFNTTTLMGCKIWNNTLYATNTSKNTAYGAFTNDWGLPSGAIDVRNNVVQATPGTAYLSGSVGFDGSEGTFAKNLWFGGTDPVTFDASAVNADPMFVKPGADFHLQPGSPAIGAGSPAVGSLVVNDFDLVARTGFDIGAFQH